jgi:hypothetical protein
MHVSQVACGRNVKRVSPRSEGNAIAANFGGSSKVFSQGNFDYDSAGNVDSVDFDLIVSQYGRSVLGATTLSFRENPVAGPALFASMALRCEKEEQNLL